MLKLDISEPSTKNVKLRMKIISNSLPANILERKTQKIANGKKKKLKSKYYCSICKKSCTQKSHLNTHLNTEKHQQKVEIKRLKLEKRTIINKIIILLKTMKFRKKY